MCSSLSFVWSKTLSLQVADFGLQEQTWTDSNFGLDPNQTLDQPRISFEFDSDSKSKADSNSTHLCALNLLNHGFLLQSSASFPEHDSHRVVWFSNDFLLFVRQVSSKPTSSYLSWHRISLLFDVININSSSLATSIKSPFSGPFMISWKSSYSQVSTMIAFVIRRICQWPSLIVT